jgi:predicted dehydrogenase
MKRRIKIALIGCGSIGRSVHLKLLKKNPDVEIVALIDISENNLAASHKFIPDAKIYHKSAEFFQNERADAVVIATPPDTHVKLAKAALLSGMAVYLEKPLGQNCNEGEELVRIANDTKLTAMIGFNFQFNPLIERLRQAIVDNKVGKVRLVRTIFSVTSEHAMIGNWRCLPANGVLSDLGSHHFSLLRYFFKLPITCVVGPSISNQNYFKSAILQMTIDGQIPVQSFFSFSGGLENRIEVIGDKGTLIADCYRFLFWQKDIKSHIAMNSINRIKKGFSFHLLSLMINRYISPWAEPSYKLALEAFLNAVRNGIQVMPDFEEGLYVLRVVDAAVDSIRKKVPIKLT